MVVYNITFGVDKDIEAEWLAWMKTKHIPDVLKTGYFLSNKIYRVVSGEPDAAPSYAVQYLCESLEKVQEYLAKESPRLRGHIVERFGNKATTYRTLLEEV